MRRRDSGLLMVIAALTAFLSGGCGASSISENVSSSEPSTNAYRPQIKIDYNGSAVIVWYQWDGEHYNIYSSRYEAGTGWKDAELIEFDDTGDAYDPQIALDPNGNAVAVWYQLDGEHYNILSNRYNIESGWGTPELIETDDTNNAYDPGIVIDSNGNAIAVWRQWDGMTSNIWSNRYDSKTGWGKEKLIELDNKGNAHNPYIAANDNGNAVVVWSQSDGTHYNIWSNQYNKNTGWGTAQLIETDNIDDADNPVIVINDNGNAIAVWSQSDGTRYNIWSNRYDKNIGWRTAKMIETNNDGNAYHPQITIDSNGNAVAVWYQWDGRRNNIWSNIYKAAAGWGSAVLIETSDDGDAYNPQLAVDSRGNAVAVWYMWDVDGSTIWFNNYITETGWNAAGLLDSGNNGYIYYPGIAVDSNGNALAVWSQSDDTGYKILSNRFTMDTG